MPAGNGVKAVRNRIPPLYYNASLVNAKRWSSYEELTTTILDLNDKNTAVTSNQSSMKH